MLIRLSGSFMLLRLLQDSNADAEMLVIPSGIITFLIPRI